MSRRIAIGVALAVAGVALTGVNLWQQRWFLGAISGACVVVLLAMVVYNIHTYRRFR